jgi:hypothetical protein
MMIRGWPKSYRGLRMKTSVLERPGREFIKSSDDFTDSSTRSDDYTN